VPFFAQHSYQCGPAALAMTLQNAGLAVTPDELVQQVYLPERKGSLQVEMLAVPRRYGMISYQLAPRFEDLLKEIAAGNPVIVLHDQGAGPISSWHYAVVVGYDYPAGELILRSGTTRRTTLPFTIFEYFWKKSNYWSMVVLPANRIPASATESTYLSAVTAMAQSADKTVTTNAYKNLLVRWPDNLTASIALGNYYYSAGALSDAEQVLRDANRRHPDSVVVMNNLGQTLSDQGQNNEALTLLDRAQAQASPFSENLRETRELIVQRLKH
jgi:tetratricopeptide (TPR) repeat protein